jgi:hypothetical protein
MLALTLVPLAPEPVYAATYGPPPPVSMEFVMGLDTPDTRGGMVLDDQYVWISDHKGGLNRFHRCTGTADLSLSGDDSKSWDLWFYNDPVSGKTG